MYDIVEKQRFNHTKKNAVRSRGEIECQTDQTDFEIEKCWLFKCCRETWLDIVGWGECAHTERGKGDNEQNNVNVVETETEEYEFHFFECEHEESVWTDESYDTSTDETTSYDDET